MRRDTEETEKYYEKLKISEQVQREKIIVFENENNNLDDEINKVMGDLAELDRRIAEAHAQIKDLAGDIAETQGLC